VEGLGLHLSLQTQVVENLERQRLVSFVQQMAQMSWFWLTLSEGLEIGAAAAVFVFVHVVRMNISFK
jgi:hypothetical protein